MPLQLNHTEGDITEVPEELDWVIYTGGKDRKYLKFRRS
jgi:hypothetical protein